MPAAPEPQDVKCGHCRNNTVWKLHDQYNLDEEYALGTQEVYQVRGYCTFMCSTCLRPTLLLTIGAFSVVDAEWLGVSTKVLYPQPLSQLDNLPEAVENRYNAALKVRYVEPNSFAVMAGRTLETACNHENAQGKDLAAKLNYLANKDRIPQTLAEMAHQLRQLRNLGAHDADDEINEADVPIILDFLEAILEYLYVAPAKVEALKNRLK